MKVVGLELNRFGAFPQRLERGWDIMVSDDRIRPSCFQVSHNLEREIFDRLQ